MKQSLTTTPRYDVKTIWLHWLTAVLVITLWCLGQTIDWFPRGTPRVYARSAHISIGALLGIVLLYRIWWRATAGEHLSAAGSGGLKIIAKSMHMALYIGMLATVILGVSNAWVRGDNLFNLYKLPAFAGSDKALRATVEDYHAYAANLLLILAALHATAGLVHQYILRADVLGRMLPALGRR